MLLRPRPHLHELSANCKPLETTPAMRVRPAQVVGKRITENMTSYHKFYSFFKCHNDKVTLPLRSLTKNNTFPGYISVKLKKLFKNEFIMLKTVFRETQESRDVT